MKFIVADKLPVARAFLHFEASRITDEEIQVDYELVLPLDEADCRGTFDQHGRKVRPKNFLLTWLDVRNNKRIPLGRSLIGTGNKNYPFNVFSPEDIDLPFRDGAHSTWDNEKLGGLPVYYTRGNEHWILLPKNKATGA